MHNLQCFIKNFNGTKPTQHFYDGIKPKVQQHKIMESNDLNTYITCTIFRISTI